MSVIQYAQQLLIKRDVPPIAFIDDDFSVIVHEKQKRTQESQIGLKVKRYGYQRKLELERERYREKREPRLQQIKKYRAENPEKVKEWQDKHNKENRQYKRVWAEQNREKCKQYTYKYRAKKLATMTPEQQKEYKKQLYQQTRQSMIEKHGLDGWRAICAERNRASRQKKKELKNDN
jgi:hypothetical protein